MPHALWRHWKCSAMFCCYGTQIYDPEVRDEGSGQLVTTIEPHDLMYNLEVEPLDHVVSSSSLFKMSISSTFS